MAKTLIVPVDGSEAAERALTCGQLLAAHFDPCDIVVMTASTEADDRRRAYIHALVDQATETRIRAEFVIGDPAPSIVRMAEMLPDPVVCMATHGRGRLSTPLLGSVATEVVRRLEAPLLLVGPHCETDWWHDPAKLVVCWNGEDSNPILAAAEHWSRALGMELWLESVFHPLDVRSSVEPRREFAPALACLANGGEGVPTLALRADFPPGAIVRSAHEFPATILAMTTRARRGIGRAVLGSVTMDVVHHSPCPVLVAHGS